MTHHHDSCPANDQHPPSPVDDLAALRLEIAERVSTGHLDLALTLAEEGIALAQSADDSAAYDQMLCNRGAILVAKDEGAEVVPDLRRVLMRNVDPATRFFAAYAISEHHVRLEEYERSSFYARTALGHAEAWGDRASIAKAFNQLANVKLLTSYFDEARQAYSRALDLISTDAASGHPIYSIESAILLSNLGYCQTILGHHDDAFTSLFRSLREVRRLGVERWQHLPRLTLAHAYLEVGRYRRAEHHAAIALQLAEACGLEEKAKNALYLLGEATKLDGRIDEATDHFLHLQRRFYPDQPMVADVLLSADIRHLINLMA